VRIELLPYADESFDGVLSQFGFEYAEERAASAEAARVLKHTGLLRLVLHAREGAVVRDISNRLERLRSALDAKGPVGLVRSLSLSPEQNDSPAVVQQAWEGARALTRNAPTDDAAAFYATAFLRLWARRHQYRLSDVTQTIEDGWQRASAISARFAEMARVARSLDQVTGLGRRFSAHGLRLERVVPVYDNGDQIAWLLDATK
jgi:SAM-dependent methyltransferase